MDVHYTANSGFSYYFETATCWVFLPFSGGTASGGCRGQYLTTSGQGHFDQAATWRFCDEDIPD
jgi:hypothetical protein